MLVGLSADVSRCTADLKLMSYFDVFSLTMSDYDREAKNYCGLIWLGLGGSGTIRQLKKKTKYLQNDFTSKFDKTSTCRANVF